MSVAFGDLAERLEREGFHLDGEPLAALAGYLDLLLRWNKAMNLVGTRTWQDTVSRLIVDSLHLGRFLETMPLPEAPLCWDPGAGAGLPGIPLRMIWQRGTYWMIEAREKRALFLASVLARHPLPETHVFRGRLEAFCEQQADGPPADLVVSRAFMPWRQLLPLMAPHLAPGGFVVFLLNEDTDLVPARIGEAAPGWEWHACLPYTAASESRVLHAVRRLSSTAGLETA